MCFELLDEEKGVTCVGVVPTMQAIKKQIKSSVGYAGGTAGVVRLTRYVKGPGHTCINTYTCTNSLSHTHENSLTRMHTAHS